MKRWIVLALVASAAFVHAQGNGKKELAQKIVTLQQGPIENLAGNLVQQPAQLLLSEAERVLRTQVPEDRRAKIAAAVQAAAKTYMDEAAPVVRERALKLAPSAFGNALEQKFSEEELKQIIAWMESPTSKKFAQVTGEAQKDFVQALVADARPVIDPKVAALEQAVRAAFAASAPAASGASAPRPARAPAPAKAASK